MTKQTYHQRRRAYRWGLNRLSWWLPVIKRYRLASGPCGGWHCWWGPLHVWSVVTHNGRADRGVSWK